MAKETTTKVDLEWKTIDPESLADDHRKLYDTYKAAYKLASAARVAFETKLRTDAGLPDGKTLVFGYRYGQLGVAIGDTAKAKSSKAASMSDVIAGAKTVAEAKAA